MTINWFVLCLSIYPSKFACGPTGLPYLVTIIHWFFQTRPSLCYLYHNVLSIVPSGIPHLVIIIHWFFQTSILLFVIFITMFYLLYPLAFHILLLLYIDSFRAVSFSLLSLSQCFISCTLWHSASCYYYTLILSDQYPSLCCLYHNVSSIVPSGFPSYYYYTLILLGQYPSLCYLYHNVSSIVPSGSPSWYYYTLILSEQYPCSSGKKRKKIGIKINSIK